MYRCIASSGLWPFIPPDPVAQLDKSFVEKATSTSTYLQFYRNVLLKLPVYLWDLLFIYNTPRKPYTIEHTNPSLGQAKPRPGQVACTTQAEATSDGFKFNRN